MKEVKEARRLADFIGVIETLSQMVGSRVEVLSISKRAGKSETKKYQGVISEVVQKDFGSDCFLIINIEERHWVVIDFFGNKQYILSIKDLASKRFLYKKQKAPR